MLDIDLNIVVFYVPISILNHELLVGKCLKV